MRVSRDAWVHASLRTQVRRTGTELTLGLFLLDPLIVPLGPSPMSDTIQASSTDRATAHPSEQCFRGTRRVGADAEREVGTNA